MFPIPNPPAIVWTSGQAAYDTSSADDGVYNSTSGDIPTVQAWIDREFDLSTIGKFKDNWDGFNATAPDPAVVANALSFLRTIRKRDPASPPMRAVVSPDGLIALEWLEGRHFIRAEIEDSNEVEWMIAVPGQPTEFSIEYFVAPTVQEPLNQTWQPARSAASEFAYT